MSITTEITRLQGAKANLKTAIESKGVTVPSSATLDDYAALVDSISGGGGISVDDLVQNLAPSGAITLGSGVTEIKDYSLYGAPITSISGANVTKIGANALGNTNITSITDANFPKLGVDSTWSVMLKCTSLQHIELTGTRISLASGSDALRNNTGLITAKFPNAAKNVGSITYVGAYCFAGCTNLILADCGYVASISRNAFNGASKINTIIFRSSSVVSLSNINAFSGTRFANGGAGGTIYIPKSLYDHLGDNSSSDYKNASNWSTIDGYGTITWAKIEGSEYEL